jgi:hypothetical protein
VDPVDHVNAARIELGLPLLRRDDSLSRAAAAHASVIVDNPDHFADPANSPHRETPDLDGFTGETLRLRLGVAGFDGRAISEVIGQHRTSVASSQAWLESLYHRLPLLHPRASLIGYAAADRRMTRADVAVIGASPSDRGDDASAAGDALASRGWGLPPTNDPLGPRVAVYPAPGASGVTASWDGNEVPQPEPPPAGYPSGTVVTLQTDGRPLRLISGTVTGVLEGSALALSEFSAATDPVMPPTRVAVSPHRPLDQETAYEVEIVAVVAGELAVWRWTFVTGGLACDPAAQDCGPGRGCFVIDGMARCLWAGQAEIGDYCHYVNDCAAGGLCAGDVCRPLCDADAPAGSPRSCAARCLTDSAPVGGAHAVCIGRPCGSAQSTCGPGEACVWSGVMTCEATGSLAEGAACDRYDACAPGLVCAESAGERRCSPLCDGPGTPRCGDICRGGSAPLADRSDARRCR